MVVAVLVTDFGRVVELCNSWSRADRGDGEVGVGGGVGGVGVDGGFGGGGCRVLVVT